LRGRADRRLTVGADACGGPSPAISGPRGERARGAAF
jgi:hypothetical protein